MARLIVKSPYIKCGSNGAVGGYMKYIATRERVEIVPDDRPPTRKQEQLITKLAKDFPGVKSLYEYEDYLTKPTKANASTLITLALEENWTAVHSSEGYAKYIATRPRAEQFGDHGLFGDADGVDLTKAMSELEHYTGNVWTHIISLKREDAARLGYDSAAAWRALLRTHRNDIAAAMHIPPNDFRWYAAFHDEGDHPHVHMMAWSVKPGQAYLDKDGIRQIKSRLTNQIFRQELLHLYEQKSASRDELVHEARRELQALVRTMGRSIADHPQAEQLMSQLAEQLDAVKGKKSYGYLPKSVKKTVDEIVDQMEDLPVVKQCYDQWVLLQSQVDNYYHDKRRVRRKLSEEKEFRQIKNAVIKEAERIRLGEVTFEDRDLRREDEPDQFPQSTCQFDEMWGTVRNDDLTMEERSEYVSELEQMAVDGDPYAQYAMGILHRDGPLLIPDAVNSRYWLDLSAQGQIPAAQYALGKLYLSNDPEIHDARRGMEWLTEVARNGNHYAAYRLGKEYLTGKNTERDPAKAVGYFKQAADQGNQYAQYMLGKLYLLGRDVPYDKEKALRWLSESAVQGNQYARFFLDRQDSLRPPPVMLSVPRLLYHMSRIFQDNSLPQSHAGLHIDSKLRQRIREKKIAMGHKADDHEEEMYGPWNMTMGGM